MLRKSMKNQWFEQGMENRTIFPFPLALNPFPVSRNILVTSVINIDIKDFFLTITAKQIIKLTYTFFLSTYRPYYLNHYLFNRSSLKQRINLTGQFLP
jgi:hypothetical protein